MPAFVANGPDIPESLLQAHEEGRVVFFCGAGISYPAGLPGFGGLVKGIYKDLGVLPSAVQEAAIKAGQFDTAIDLLEADIVGGREVVRGAISRILTPSFIDSKATVTHSALLTLARNRDGRRRLITTNFDRLFEEVIASAGLEVERYKAPLLPVPKNRWDGLVYLHGLLPSLPRASEFDRLVLSSGDFGLAYLIERWAARFVSELFRNYSVCFIGYSINDPVLRYMMDALAADRMLGESPPEMFAFGSYSKGKEDKSADEWRAKKVTPILYREYKRHAYLHRTLREWANTYRDGVRGKEMIIAQHANTPPLAPSRSDFSVGRVLWALTDGLAAKHFADLSPVPPLKWLEPLSENQYLHRDLSLFGVFANSKEDKELRFSAVHRPAPYTQSPRMCIVDMGARGSNLDDVMFQLARWLTRHLDDPGLIIWLAKYGGQLNEQFGWLVRDQLEKLERLDAEGKQDELARIRAEAPRAIPGPLMRTLWRIILAGRIKSRSHHLDLYDLLRRIKLDGVTPSLRMELREVLMPCVTLRAPFYLGDDAPDPSEPKSITDLVQWDLELSGDYVHSALRDLTNKPMWHAVLPDLLQDFTVLLHDALDLRRELGSAVEKSDLSYIHQPSISEHTQNRDFHDWMALVELARDAWMATAQNDQARAHHIAEGWWQVPYPVFKRLALFAAAQNDVISRRQALDWLLANERWWLWSVETQREAIRLLVVLSPKLDMPELIELEQAILRGPPREMFKEDLEQNDWERIVDRGVWLRLAKMQTVGTAMSDAAKTKLEELARQHARWQLAKDDRDEFPFWMESGWEGEVEVPLGFELAPSSREELVKWLLKYPSAAQFDHQDGWRERCRNYFTVAIGALADVAEKGQWPLDRWREALQVGAEDALLNTSWPILAKILVGAPDAVIKPLSQSLSWWLKTQAKSFSGQEELFFTFIHRLIELEGQDRADKDG